MSFIISIDKPSWDGMNIVIVEYVAYDFVRLHEITNQGVVVTWNSHAFVVVGLEPNQTQEIFV